MDLVWHRAEMPAGIPRFEGEPQFTRTSSAAGAAAGGRARLVVHCRRRADPLEVIQQPCWVFCPPGGPLHGVSGMSGWAVLPWLAAP